MASPRWLGRQILDAAMALGAVLLYLRLAGVLA
jgi:hypothetical protein